MGDNCCAVGCSNTRNKYPELSFYRIPKGKTVFERNRRELWLKALRRKDWPEHQIDNAKLCSKHFISGRPTTVVIVVPVPPLVLPLALSVLVPLPSGVSRVGLKGGFQKSQV